MPKQWFAILPRMRRSGAGWTVAVGLLALLSGSSLGAPGLQPFMTSSHEAAPPDPEVLNAAMKKYCQGCHNDLLEWAGLTLESFRVEKAEQDPALAERVIRKLRTRMMPPSTVPRPDETTYESLANYLESRMDESAVANPDAGERVFQRLNRAEYANSVRDLLGLDVDPSAFLPADTVSHGFDNIADVQTPSATLMEGYLRAASWIARVAIGDPGIGPSETTYKVARTASQLDHVEGAPMGTRGGLSVVHNFPADGEYVFKIVLHGTPTGQLFGLTSPGEQLEVSVDGARAALLDIDPHLDESDPEGLNVETPPVAIKTGPHRVSVAFIDRAEGPVDDIIAPIHHTLADTQIGSAWGITTVPHLRNVRVSGPYNVTGVSDSPTRRRVFTCRPVSPDEAEPCAKKILSGLATAAYRRPVNDHDVEGLMAFYRLGADGFDFENGIRTGLQAILASPHFVFRLERVRADGVGSNRLVSDLDLVTRLSYFLWATGPDRELLEIAEREQLVTPADRQQLVRKMLDDPRASALATRFASQWLRLQDLHKVHPDALEYPYYDHTLADSLKHETELLFLHLVQEDRSVLELLTADFTFVNERVADHYGLSNVTGNHFRKVSLQGTERRGVLGHGSILTLTSNADRTSPVQRGKWILEVLLGTDPPPPPPNVPALEDTKGVADGKLLSVRERMEEHRSNPACTSCHRVIDPLGLALENFDVTGRWRSKDNGVPIDPSDEMYDGSRLVGPAGLREALLNRSHSVITSFTESLLTYAVGRRLEPSDMPTVRSIIRQATRDGYRVSAFISAVTESHAFRMKRVEPAQTVATTAPK